MKPFSSDHKAFYGIALEKEDDKIASNERSFNMVTILTVQAASNALD